jgi:hypothetical protein
MKARKALHNTTKFLFPSFAYTAIRRHRIHRNDGQMSNGTEGKKSERETLLSGTPNGGVVSTHTSGRLYT